MKMRGSALIIAMLLVAAVGGIAFGAGKMLFLESGTATLYQNGAVAYYAAESGIEEGFLRYRYNQNAEIPQSNWILVDNKVYRTSLADNSVDSGVGSVGVTQTNSVASPAKQYYDLRMGYIGANGQPWYGPANILDIKSPQNYPTDTTGATYIAKDDSKTIDLSNLWSLITTNKLDLFGQFTGINSNLFCNVMLEAKLSIKYSGQNNTQQFTELYYDPLCFSLPVDQSKLSQLTMISGSGLSFKIPNIIDGIRSNAGAANPNKASSVSLNIKPIFPNYSGNNAGLVFGLSTSDCELLNSCQSLADSQIPAGPDTTIVSDGYFGGVDKKLSANIDRQSGSLYDLYDYVIFTNGS